MVLMIKRIIMFSILILILQSFSSYAKQVVLNDTTEYVINPISNKLFTLSNNVTIQDNINHTFEGKLDTTFADYDVQYVASNGTGILLHIRMDGGSGSNTDRIQKFDCSGVSTTSVCSGGCGGNEFDDLHEFTVSFDALANNAKIFIDGAQQGIASLCIEFSEIGKINFTGIVSQSRVKNNLVIADEPVSAVCGNGNVETGEQCDDGNTNSGDGCSDICETEPVPIPEFTLVGIVLILISAGVYGLFQRRRL